jgi:SRSO17 transposase
VIPSGACTPRAPAPTEAAGDSGPWRQQAILGRGRWDADALRDIVRDYAVETLADGNAVLVIDETGFLKQGKASCSVARQCTGSAGKIINCQILFAAYVIRHGHAFMPACPLRFKLASSPGETRGMRKLADDRTR